MTLIVHELKASPLEQTVTCEKNTIVEAIRPHIYRHNFPAGTLKLEIYDDSASLVAESEVLDISTIGTMDYLHGYIRFYVNAYLKKDETYTLKLVSGGGYSFDESAYIGWCNGFDLGKYPTNSVPANIYHYPLDFEIWERTVK